MKRILIKLIIFALFTLLILSGCGGNPTSKQTTPSAQTANVVLRLKVPDYINDGSFHSQVIDLATSTVEINVSAPDIAPITKTVNVSFAYNNEDAGYYVDCVIKVPVGVARLFVISAKDSSGNILTQGNLETDISLNYDNFLRICLLPVNPTVLAVNGSQNGSVEYGRTDYYQVDMSATELCQIRLQGSSDLRLLVFYADGSYNYNATYNWGPSKGITAIIDNVYIADHKRAYYLGVLGNNQGGTSSYSLTSHTVTGTSFAAFEAHDLSPLSDFPSIAATGTELNFARYEGSIEEDFKVIPIGFNFNYHGMTCDRIFVSPFGAVSVQPFKISSFSDSLGSPNPPNDLIALFIGYPNYQHNGQIFYELRGPSGSRELVVEYRSIQVGSPAGSQTISGQIILCEGSDPTSDPIKFLYDRANCSINSSGTITIGTIGIENENGSDTRGPLDVTALPENDLEFRKP